MLNQPGFVPYTLLDSSILVQRKAGRDEYRLSTPHPATLLIKETKAKRWQRLYQPKRRNTIAFTTIEYTQLTSFDSFAAFITNEGQVDLTITFHPTIEAGHYQGQLNDKYRLLLQELLASFDPVVEPVFNPDIISDIQEWRIHTACLLPRLILRKNETQSYRSSPAFQLLIARLLQWSYSAMET